MKAETKRMLKKIKSIRFDKMNKIIDIIAKENNKSKLYIKIDLFLNFLKRGVGYTDYFRGNYINLTEKEKDTFVTAKSFYRLLHTLNDYNYIGIFNNKLIFNEFFREYIKRDFINLKKATKEEFEHFLDNHKVVFAKDPLGEGGHGIKKIRVDEITNRDELYNELINNKQFLLEEEIIQSKELNEINPNVVNSFRVNQDASDVIGCTNDLYFSFAEDGTINSNVIDDYGNIYEKHPLTGKKFSDVKVADVKEAFEMCKKASLEIQEVRYVGWDVAFAENGPVIVEGNEYPGYGILQFYKLTNKRTGHLKEIQDVLGEDLKWTKKGFVQA